MRKIILSLVALFTFGGIAAATMNQFEGSERSPMTEGEGERSPMSEEDAERSPMSEETSGE